MKKILLILTVLFTATCSIYADDKNVQSDKTSKKKQVELTDTSKTSKAKTSKAKAYKYSHWSIGVNGGISMMDGDQNNRNLKIAPYSIPSFAFHAQVEYMVSPTWGLNLQYNYLPYNGGHKTDLHYKGLSHDATLNGVFNILNLFNQNRNKLRWGLNIHAGVGIAFYNAKLYDTEDNHIEKKDVTGKYTIVFPIGLSVEYAPIDWLGIYFQAEYRTYRKDDLDCMIQGRSYDNIPYAGLGLRYRICASKNRPHARNYSVYEYHPNPTKQIAQENKLELAEVNSRIDDINNRINNEILPTITEMKNNLVKTEADSDMDGVPDSRDRNPNTPAGSFVNYYGEPLTANEINKILGNTRQQGENVPTVYFNTDSYSLTQQGRITVAEIAAKMYNNSHLYLDIVGYCDNMGDTAYNNQLSIKRAETVKNELIKKYGIDESRINIIGKGMQEGPTKNFMINRRCELILKRK